MTQFLSNFESFDLAADRRSLVSDIKHLLSLNHAIVSNIPFSLVVTDLQGIILLVNPVAEMMLGYAEGELVGRSIVTIHDVYELVDGARRLSEEVREPITSAVDVLTLKLLRGIRESTMWTYICKDRTRVPVQVTMSPIQDENGNAIALIASAQDITDRLQVDKYIYHLAYHDTLTGLPGRDILRKRIEVANQQSSESGCGFALLMVDIDQFKRINDSLGHDAGDTVLREVGLRLQKQLRTWDTVARFGGDEFIVLLGQMDSSEAAEQYASVVMEVFREPIDLGTSKVKVTASVGLSFHKGEVEHGDILRNADIALFRSKAIGRSGVSVFTQDMAECRLTTLKMEGELRDAIDREEFFLVYQPQICMQTGRITGVEALVRWISPVSGLVMPGTFIPVAEESGLIVEIGAWCLKTACREIASLQKDLGYSISVAVNLSPRQVHAEGFQATVERALAESGLQPSCLELEITEGLLMSYSDEVHAILERVQALGVTMAIDDFGTGFSNLSYITRFRVDRLKIDRSFIARCLTDRNSMAVTKAIIALAHSLGLKVVAEGIETAEQAAELSRLRYDSAQGYFYSTPLGIGEVRSLARSPSYAAGSFDLSPALSITAVRPREEATLAWRQTQHAAIRPFDPVEPRDPLCRPTSPARLPGAARRIVSLCAEEETDLPARARK